MGDKCNHCGATEVHRKNVELPDQSKINDVIVEALTRQAQNNNYPKIVQNPHHHLPKVQANNTQEVDLTLNNLLPDNHLIFEEMNKNSELEQSGFDNRRNALTRFYELHELAKSQRKYAKKTRDWMKHKSPFMDPDFRKKLENPNSFTKTMWNLCSEPCQRKEVICTNCGTVVRVFIDIEDKIETILESVQVVRTYLDYLSRYDSAMTNWERDDKAEKAKAAKIRAEKKLQADIEALELERKKTEEKLRKLKGE
jgi:hypothetical protein